MGFGFRRITCESTFKQNSKKLIIFRKTGQIYSNRHFPVNCFFKDGWTYFLAIFCACFFYNIRLKFCHKKHK